MTVRALQGHAVELKRSGDYLNRCQLSGKGHQCCWCFQCKVEKDPSFKTVMIYKNRLLKILSPLILIGDSCPQEDADQPQ